jgi:hypothetical protein
MSKDNLVSIEPNKEEQPLTLSQSFKDVLKLTINPIIGSFFHPVYTIVNAATLGHAG